jgi:hypothetical protein
MLKRKMACVWWRSPIVIFLAAAAVLTIPPYASQGFELLRAPEITAFLLTHSIKSRFAPLFPVFNILALLLLAGIMIRGRVFRRAFGLFLSSAYLLGGLLQSISISDRYGFSVSVSTLAVALLAALIWLREFLANKDAFGQPVRAVRLLGMVPFALLALWQPVNPVEQLPDFQLRYFLTSGSSLTFCMLTTLSLSVLIAHFPDIDCFVLFISSAFGLLVGLGNLWLEFVHLPELFWTGVLHIPLVGLSIVGLVISFRSTSTNHQPAA